MGAIAVTSQDVTSSAAQIRPPAVPLVTVDPYFSVWSMADKLTDDSTRHWTGASHPMCGLARIDGKPYRFAGVTPSDVPPMTQLSVTVHPTRTVYRFAASGVELTVTFLTPLLLSDPDLTARPASYVYLEVAATDGARHKVSLYLDVSADLVVNKPEQEVRWNRNQFVGNEPLTVLKVGSQEQLVLEKSGDDLRIDWGYLYMVFPTSPEYGGAILSDDEAQRSFARTGGIPAHDDIIMPRPAREERPVMACSMNLGEVDSRPVSRLITLVYDDMYSVQYFRRRLRPYWRCAEGTVEQLIVSACREFKSIHERCCRLDQELMADALSVGGRDYADIVALSYRQAIAAHKLAADRDDRALLFSKECFSGACMATVDVTYPSAPIFLLFNTDMLRAALEPVFEYAASPAWPYEFAPHDVGEYPHANGQAYAGGNLEDIDVQMPVEESANMLIMVCAMAFVDGNADYAVRHWDLLSQWAGFLKTKGLDPDNQLCTDDFAGHLAHNANLSVKAITGLACYSRLAEMIGKKRIATEYRKAAESMAAKWKTMAIDGDHYVLAFDQPGTWSQKYNLIWDKVLGLNLFDPEIAATEVASYKKRLRPFGLPLDSRKTYTKADWIVWSAALAESEADFRAIIAPLRKFLHESPDRAPFSDYYETINGKIVSFRARSVVGGVFIKMLTDEALRRKWSSRAAGERTGLQQAAAKGKTSKQRG